MKRLYIALGIAIMLSACSARVTDSERILSALQMVYMDLVVWQTHNPGHVPADISKFISTNTEKALAETGIDPFQVQIVRGPDNRSDTDELFKLTVGEDEYVTLAGGAGFVLKAARKGKAM